MKAFILGLLFVSFGVEASFLPPGFTPDKNSFVGGEPQITEKEFNERIEALRKTYAPIIANFGATFELKAEWANNKFIAEATQPGTWKVEFSGGLARTPQLSGDAMTLIICHEIGHHVAGFPFVKTAFKYSWGAAEGQSDYYSTQVCAKKMWENETEINSTFVNKVRPLAKTQCDLTYASDAERHLCYRTTVASESLILTMATLMRKKMPQYDTPDRGVTTGTMSVHPAVQCRFDTLFQGNICPQGFNDAFIPGKDVSEGRASLEAEKEAAEASCTASGNFTRGLRPTCWFKARL